MSLIVWLVLGGVVGWLASLLLHADARQAMVLNIAVGVFGAFLAGWFVAPLAGLGTTDQIQFSPASIVVALGGAAVMLAVLNLFRKSRAR